MENQQIPQNSTENISSDIKPLVLLSLPKTPEQKEQEKKDKQKKEEQERTRIKKQMFLEYLPKSFGVVGDTCEKIGIDRGTYYDWKNNDPQFAEAISKIDAQKNDWVEDQLYKLMRKGDGPSVRFHMERRNPLYKQKSINEIYTGEKTLEDLLDAFADKKIEEKQNGNTNTSTTEIGGTTGQQTDNREIVQDKK